MRILLADDQAEVRSALRLLFEHDHGLMVVDEAERALGLAELVDRTEADVVLLDCELPGLDLRALLLQLRQLAQPAKVLALSGRSEGKKAAMDAGVDAFVSKGEPPEALLAALHSLNRRS